MSTRKKKILYVITKSNWGGAQRYVFDLATGLSKEMFDVVVALGGTGNKHAETGRLAEKLTQESIPIITIRSFMRNIHLLSDIRSFFELLTILKKEKPDIVHLNSSKAGGIGALAGRIAGVKKIIFTAHGFAFNENRFFISKIIIYLLSWLTIVLSTKTIVITKNEYSRILPWPLVGKKITYIQNGIDSPEFIEKEKAREYLATRIGKPLDYFRNNRLVGTIGELTQNKGLKDAILALARTNFTYVIIGTGEQQESLTEYIRENKLHEKIFLTGFIADASKYLKAFDIFLLPSYKEGLPYVLLEAGYASVPFVARDIGGIPDIINTNENGILFHDNNDISSALTKVNGTHAKKLFLTVTNNNTKEKLRSQTYLLY
ncbi:MAG: glycosyltransferase [Candidatus Paceibacterota bacterium]